MLAEFGGVFEKLIPVARQVAEIRQGNGDGARVPAIGGIEPKSSLMAFQIAAVPVVIAAPRAGVAIALLCVAFFLLPQPRPRYKPGEEPSSEEKTSE